MLSTHVPCNCLGSINLRRPPIWDVKHHKTKKRIWMEALSDAGLPHHNSSQGKPTWGSKQQIRSKQQKLSSTYSITPQNYSFTKPYSDLSPATTDNDPIANLTFRPPKFSSSPNTKSAPFVLSRTPPSASPSASSSSPPPSSSYSSFTLRYPCLGAMNLRRPPIWDMKHVPVARRISPTYSSASRISPTLSSAARISPSIPTSSNTSSMNGISSTISSTSLVRGLKGFTMSIFDQAWVLTDVASDWLFPQSHVIVAEEKAMKDEEEHEDEGIMIDEPLTFDHLSLKETSQIGSPSPQSDCRKRKAQLQIAEEMMTCPAPTHEQIIGCPTLLMSDLSRSDKDSDSSSDSEVSIADSGVFCSSLSNSVSWAEPKSKKKKYGAEL